MDDPVADGVRSIVDGHIILDRNLAHRGHYPAIHILSSISRLSTVLLDDIKLRANQQLRENLAIYKEAEDLINIGGYRKGNNERWDRAILLYPRLIEFLRQNHKDYSKLHETVNRLEGILRG